MGLTVSGFVNGLDVSTVVSQLMQSESIPQAKLQGQLTTVQSQASTYRAINSKFQALLTAAQAMTNSATWNTTKASSSDPSVAVASTGTAQAGSLAFTVTQIAAAESQITTASPPYSSTTAPYANGTIQFVDSSGKATTITVGGSGTLTDAVNAINAANLGVTASVTTVGTNQYQLRVTSNTTGAASKFTLDGGAGWSETTAGQDAQLSVGMTNKYTVTSPTNTISGLMPGVTLTVAQTTASPVTVNVVSDPQSIGDQMQALVDAANAALSEISKDTDTGMGSSSSSGKAGPLAGDYTMQNLAQQVRKIVSAAVGALGSPAQVGLQLNSDGTIAFDEGTFISTLKNDPTLAQSMVNGTTAVPGIAAQLVTLTKSATDSVTGTLVTLANGQDSQAKTLQDQIDAWTVRLQTTQQNLTATYSNLQAMLSSLQNQQSWLSSMFNAMTNSTSSSSSSKSS